MKALFLVLLLANLLYLAWNTWIETPPALPGQAVIPAPEGPGRVRLLRELTPDAPRPATGVAALPADLEALSAATCVSAGPFLDRAAAERAAGQLNLLGYGSRLRAATEEVSVGQWARVTDLATADDAANAVAVLSASGLADAEIVSDEGPARIVSLGVFGDPARAAEVVELARRAGFAAALSARLRTAEVYWLDVDRQSNGGLPSLEDLQDGAPLVETPLELRACPAAAAPAG